MAEGAPLLRAYGLKPIEGSNPSLSAIHRKRGLVPLFLWIIEGGFEPSKINWLGSTSGEAVKNAGFAGGPEGEPRKGRVIPPSPPYSLVSVRRLSRIETNSQEFSVLVGIYMGRSCLIDRTSFHRNSPEPGFSQTPFYQVGVSQKLLRIQGAFVS